MDSYEFLIKEIKELKARVKELERLNHVKSFNLHNRYPQEEEFKEAFGQENAKNLIMAQNQFRSKTASFQGDFLNAKDSFLQRSMALPPVAPRSVIPTAKFNQLLSSYTSIQSPLNPVHKEENIQKGKESTGSNEGYSLFGGSGSSFQSLSPPSLPLPLLNHPTQHSMVMQPIGREKIVYTKSELIEMKSNGTTATAGGTAAAGNLYEVKKPKHKPLDLSNIGKKVVPSITATYAPTTTAASTTNSNKNKNFASFPVGGGVHCNYGISIIAPFGEGLFNEEGDNGEDGTVVEGKNDNLRA